ncbi:MAG TPA: ATP-dependent DNA helicase PcrA, partial [Acholeplasmataceae bacterium]|nr:ATP-dependent DNA helicase PcrA [Acholeplasmataceae bacterium]
MKNFTYDKMGDEMILNEEQKKVVYSNERFLFLLAGAGSGKTRVIVERIKYLIENGVEPSQILAITFTRKASFEMKDRVNNSLVHIHTFHQFCYQ